MKLAQTVIIKARSDSGRSKPKRNHVKSDFFGGSRTVKTKLNLKPGQRGTKRLCEKYGDSLVRVRYQIRRNQEKAL